MMVRVLCFLSFILCGTAFAASNDELVARYAPFFNGKPWPRFPIVTYVERGSNVWVHPTETKKFATVTETHDLDTDFTTVVITFPDGRRFKTYNSFVLGPYLSSVYTGDFNGDGKPDFAAVKPGSGNGLAGEFATLVFAFSAENDYRFTRVTMMGIGEHDFVVEPKTREFRFIHTSFRSGETQDGRFHSFWVHRFYKWNGVAFQCDTNLSPVWIQYLDRPNHEPTKLLDTNQKAKIWAEGSEFNARIEW